MAPGNRLRSMGRLTILLLTILLVIGTISTTGIRAAYVQTHACTIPAGPLDETELHYYGDIANSIGVGQPAVWKSAIRLTQDEMHPYMRWNLTKIVLAYDAGNGEPEMDLRIFIYDGNSPTHPGALIDNSTQVHVNASIFYTVPLTTPIPLAGHQELWIAVEWHEMAYGFCAPVDAGPHIPQKGDFCDLGDGWSELYTYGPEGNWAIGGIVEGLDDANLSIVNIAGGMGIHAGIMNTDPDTAAYNASWSITAYGMHINQTHTGSIPIIAPGTTAPIAMSWIWGLGPATIIITASAENADQRTLTRKAWILGPFVLRVH